MIKNKALPSRLLFDKEGTDSFYMNIRSECDPWHVEAKAYWQQLYHQHSQYLDDNFSDELRNDCISRLWELTLINFIADQEPKGLNRIDHRSKKKKSPDFCFEFNGRRYYIEANAPNAGNSRELKVSLDEIKGKARQTPVVSYKERICSALHVKGNINYHDGETLGYRSHMREDSGLIIAISMAKIPFFNQPLDYRVDLSCIFGLSPMKMPIIRKGEHEHFLGSPYYDHEPAFGKSKTNSPIKTDYFTNDAFSHISAVLISHTGWAFFPDIDQYDLPVSWEKCRNDYILIHNPFAKSPLPRSLFPVYREIFSANIHDEDKETQTISIVET